MKKFNQLLLVFAGLLALSCADNQEDFLVEVESKVIPAGSREVKINLDSKYDLSNTVAYSMYDTMAMNVNNRTLAVPHGASDMVKFVEKNTNKVLAVVALRANESQITVNAENVTAALHDILPAYATLSVEERQKFDESAPSALAYRSLVSSVDRLLTGKEGIYSTNSEFVDNLRAMNNFIAQNFAEQKTEGEANLRVAMKMNQWIKTGAAPEINNQSNGFIEAKFTPNRDDAGKDKHTFILDPKPIQPNQYSITPTSVPDGYYTLTLTQKSAAAKQANQYALANNLFFLSIGEQFNMLQNQGGEVCANSLVNTLQAELDNAFKNPPKDMNAAFLQALTIANKLSLELLTSPSCAQFNQANQALLATITQRALVVAAVLDGPKLLDQASGFLFHIEAIYMPIELQENLMIYKGKVIPGQVRFEMVERSYDKQYPRNTALNPEVKAVVMCKYGDIDFKVFEVEWQTRYSNNGTVTQSKSNFNSKGIATTNWTLPNRNGMNYLNAFIRDNEKDHLMGSPMCFVIESKN